MIEKTTSRVWFCSNVGGGVFGELQVTAWRKLGLDANLHAVVDLRDYWRAKSSLMSRLRLRSAMYIRYPLMLRAAVRRAKDAEVFVAVTNPFFAPALAARAAGHRGVKIVNLIFDLYPEALVFGGGWSRSNPASRFASATTRYAISHCAATVYLGSRLCAYAESEHGKAPQTAIIPVGTDTTPYRNCEPETRQSGVISCLYSGHMGRLHDWRTLGEILRSGIPENVRVEIAADGPGAKALRNYVPADPIPRLSFSGTRQTQDWRSAMLAADVALVTMRPGAEKVVMPSKTYSAMAAGQAVLAVCPRGSDLADLIVKHDCGWLVEPGDAVGLRSLLATLPRRAAEILQKRRNAFTAAHTLYSMEATAYQWRQLFLSLNEH